MTNENYIFEISPYDRSRLLPQVSKALEKRTEILSRERYPGLWQHTDYLNHTAQGKRRSNFPAKLVRILCLAAGIFLMVPGLVKPRELFVPLVAGLAAVVYGIAGVLSRKKNRKNPFDNSAALLLAGKDTISERQAVTVSFSGDGMTIPGENGSVEHVPYSDFGCVLETEDTLLFVYGERVAVLQKQDLTAGNLNDFSNFISGKVAMYQSI